MLIEKKLIIFGVSPFSALMKKYIERYTEYKIVAFTVEEPYRSMARFEGIETVDFETIEQRFQPESHDVLLAIGYSQMNMVRERIYGIAKEKGYHCINFIHPTVNIETSDIGEGNIILEKGTIGVDVSIGNGNIFSNGCNISHETKVGDFNFFAAGIISGGLSIIDNNCFLGLGSIIKNISRIRNRTLIGAGCYIDHSTSEDDVYVSQKSTKLNMKSIDILLR